MRLDPNAVATVRAAVRAEGRSSDSRAGSPGWWPPDADIALGWVSAGSYTSCRGGPRFAPPAGDRRGIVAVHVRAPR